jgi:hypothetical protein
MTWFRKAGAVIRARRLREAADKARRAGIGSWLKMTRRSSLGRSPKGSSDREVGNSMNLGVGEVPAGEGHLKMIS